MPINSPSLTLLATWVMAATYFAECPKFGPCIKLGDGITQSAAYLFPFLGAFRHELTQDVTGIDLAVAAGTGAIGVMSIFLIGLALRNRFRI